MVLDQVLLVALQRRTTLAGVIAPCGEETGGDLAVGVPHYFTNEGKLPFGKLVPQRRDMAEAPPNGVVRDVLVDHLGPSDAQYSSKTAVKEYF